MQRVRMARSSRQAMFPGMEADEPVEPVETSKRASIAKTTKEETSSASPGPVRASAPVPAGQAEPPNLHDKKVYAIDANSLIFQVFHAIPETTSPRGEPVSAIYGFTRDIVKLI